MPLSDSPALALENVSFTYGGAPVLDGVGFTLQKGRVLAVLGPNAVGKSTLFRCILGLEKGHSGSILLHGEAVSGLSPRRLAQRAAFVPQAAFPGFDYAVQDMVLMGTTPSLSPLAAPGPQQRKAAEEALALVGASHLGPRAFSTLSGGEKQLVLVARALAQGADLLVLDEPAANLDYGNGLRLLRAVHALAKGGKTILFSTHVPDHALWFADDVLALHEGRAAAFGPPGETVTPALLRTLYGLEAEVLERDGRLYCLPLAENQTL